MTLNITASDFFCGAGGSSTGLVAAGIEVRHAANHWDRAIETHQTNHPKTDHSLDDLQQTHAANYPKTTIAWFSPECTNHSVAKGRKRKGINQLDLWGESKVDPAEERSRATMREVVEFTEFHRYEAVIVENVIDVRKWEHYGSWVMAMTNLGYNHRVIYINAQFLGVPQSRDRFYAVFWKRGNKAPNLDFRPQASCPEHGPVDALQVWKKPEFPWGRYGKHGQYLYRCPKCGTQVFPSYSPASSVIDWSLPSVKIGDRKKPLEEKTIKRILAGLKKFGNWPHVADTSYTHAGHNGKVRSVDNPLPTQTTQQSFGLVQPFITSQHEGRQAVRSIDRELPCITTMNNEHQLVTPPFMVVLKNSHSKDGQYTLPPRTLGEPLTTLVGTASQHYLTFPPFLIVQRISGTKDGVNNPVSLDEPLRTIMTVGQHGLVTPPIIMAYHSNPVFKSVDQPMPTMMEINHHHLITPPIVMSYYGSNPTYAPVDQPLPTMRTVQHEALITPEDILPECGFRMLEPHELKLGMSFPDSYIITGNKREQVKQIGDAVCCNVAEWIAHRVVESLS